MIYDVIKILYTRQGYLPNYPPHLISDEEMCDAFLPEDKNGFSYFKDNYPCLFDSSDVVMEWNKETQKMEPVTNPDTGEDLLYEEVYSALVADIAEEIKEFKESVEDGKQLPDWVCAYMIGSVVSVNSPKEDIHDLLVMLDVDNLDDEFLKDASKLCYQVSKEWIKRTTGPADELRKPGLFGEPHVIKSLRLKEVE